MDFDFEGVFDEDYIFFYEPFHTPEVCRSQAERIVVLAGLEPGQKVLDVPCGYGRISNELALLGFNVTGLDASEMFLGHACKDSAERGAEIEYRRGDMRALPFPDGYFDVLINWFTSFGYFDDETNHRVLREFRRVLKPGGLLLLDHQNRDRMLLEFRPYSLNERDGAFMIDSAEFDPVTGRAPNSRLIVKDGQVRRTHYSVRMFAASELALWLELAGFDHLAITDIDGEPFTTKSRRMIACARAAHAPAD